MGGEIVGTDGFGLEIKRMAGAFHEGLWLANCYFVISSATGSRSAPILRMPGISSRKRPPGLNYHQRAQMTIRHAFSLNLVAVTKM